MEGSLAANFLQFTQLTDRRQQNLPVGCERRSIKANQELRPVFEGVSCVVPSARRILGVEDNTEKGNILKALGSVR